MLELKKKTFTLCMQQVNSRLDLLNESIRLLQDSANEETKSSAGDKYETGRAMAQLEIEKLGLQHSDLRKQKQVLEQIDINRTFIKIQPGCLVRTNQGIFFIAISLGPLKVDDHLIFCISPSSPIAQKLAGLTAGDSFSFNSKKYSVEQVI